MTIHQRDIAAEKTFINSALENAPEVGLNLDGSTRSSVSEVLKQLYGHVARVQGRED